MLAIAGVAGLAGHSMAAFGLFSNVQHEYIPVEQPGRIDLMVTSTSSATALPIGHDNASNGIVLT